MTKEQQYKYSILRVLNGLSNPNGGAKREDIIRMSEQSFKQLAQSIGTQKALHWAIQNLYKEGMINRPNHAMYIITNRGKAELERLAKLVNAHWNTKPGPLLLTNHACMASMSYIVDTTLEDASELRSMLQAAGIPF